MRSSAAAHRRIAHILLLTFLASAAHAAAAGSGRYPAGMVEDSSLPQHTIYRPESLAAFSGRNPLPVVVWGNGGCANAGNSSQAFLTELASHGYLVIASGPVRNLSAPRGGSPVVAAPTPAPAGTAAAQPATAVPAGETTPRVGPPPGAAGTENLSKTAQLLEALEWAAKENARGDSPYFGRVDANNAAAMGSSCGGLQAIEIGNDARVKTVIAWSSGTLDYARAGANVTRADLQKLRGPILYVLGGSNDIATSFAQKDFAVIEQVPVVLAINEGAGHGGTLGKDNGGSWAPVGVAWLDWQLKGQGAAARQFTGGQCVLCAATSWKIEKKRVD